MEILWVAEDREIPLADGTVIVATTGAVLVDVPELTAYSLVDQELAVFTDAPVDVSDHAAEAADAPSGEEA